jgi:aryl-alcohol dehydrogenase-like predicted oxidoreductase
MFRKPETEIFATLQELGIGFTAHSPVNKGFLGGGLSEYADMKTNDIRGSWPPSNPKRSGPTREFCRFSPISEKRAA